MSSADGYLYLGSLPALSARCACSNFLTGNMPSDWVCKPLSLVQDGSRRSDAMENHVIESNTSHTAHSIAMASTGNYSPTAPALRPSDVQTSSPSRFRLRLGYCCLSCTRKQQPVCGDFRKRTGAMVRATSLFVVVDSATKGPESGLKF